MLGHLLDCLYSNIAWIAWHKVLSKFHIGRNIDMNFRCPVAKLSMAPEFGSFLLINVLYLHSEQGKMYSDTSELMIYRKESMCGKFQPFSGASRTEKSKIVMIWLHHSMICKLGTAGKWRLINIASKYEFSCLTRRQTAFQNDDAIFRVIIEPKLSVTFVQNWEKRWKIKFEYSQWVYHC